MAEPDLDVDDYEMVNLVPRLTGLPMVVWAKPRGGERHDVRVKVNGVHGRRMTQEHVAVVAVRPVPRWVAGYPLPAADLRLVSDWITLNAAALVDYWDFAIDTDEFMQRLQLLPP